MRKIVKILITFLLFPIGVYALDANVGGSIVPPPSKKTSQVSEDPECISGIYRLKPNLGLRVSFYDNDGKQIGYTFDIWREVLPDSKSETSTLASENGVEAYTRKLNHGDGLPSRIDYHAGTQFNLTGTTYTFYVDTKATGNALYYTNDGAVELRKYLTNYENVQRYMNIAGVNKNARSDSDYVIVIEPTFLVEGCKRQIAYGGVYTPSEVILNASQRSECHHFDLNCDAIQYLYLEKDAKIGTTTFRAPDISKHPCTRRPRDNYKPAEMPIGDSGVGMGLIKGDEVAIESPIYKIVYRHIDLNNPFLGIDGKSRTLSSSSNWYNKETTINPSIYTETPYLTLTLTPSAIKDIRDDNKDVRYDKLDDNTYTRLANILKKYSQVLK